MPVRLWNGSGWEDGTMGISPGGSAPILPGQVRAWPWVGAVDLVGALSYPVFTAGQFGAAEAAPGTYYAANLLFSSTPLQAIMPRIVGGCDLRVLSGETGQNSLVVSAGTFAETTASGWNSKTVASPISGQPPQAAAFWDNTSYPNKSVAKAWLGKQVLMPELRVTAAVSPFITWVNAKGVQNQVIAVTSSLSDATTLAAAGVKVVFKATSGWIGDGTNPAPDTLFGLGIWGCMMPVGSLTTTRVTQCKNEGLKVWGYSVETSATAQSYVNLGVHGLYTDSPTTTTIGPVTPPPEPGTSRTYYGFGDATGGTYDGVAAQLNRGLHKPKVLRVFTGSGNASGLSSSAINWAKANNCALWVSWKPSVGTAMANPSSWVPSSIASLKTDVGKGIPCYMGVWHEPENTGSPNYTSYYSLSQWQGHWRNCHSALYDECVAARAEGYKFYVAPIICDWTFWDTSKGSASSWYPATWTDYDLMGFDMYPRGQKASGSRMIARLQMKADYQPDIYNSLARTNTGAKHDSYEHIRLCAGLAQQRGKPWGSGETGIIRGKEVGGDSLYRYTKDQRAQLYKDITEDLLTISHPPLLWCWYSHGGCNIVDEPDLPTIAAWNLSLDGNPPGVPTPP